MWFLLHGKVAQIVISSARGRLHCSDSICVVLIEKYLVYIYTVYAGLKCY